MAETQEKLRQLHRECFLLMSTIADIQTRIEKIRKQVIETDDELVEALDK